MSMERSSDVAPSSNAVAMRGVLFGLATRVLPSPEHFPARIVAVFKGFAIVACQSFWLTKTRKTTTPIPAATKVPTTSETTQFRLSIGFDRALFCAAPMPNQKRSLSIARSSFLLADLDPPHGAGDCVQGLEAHNQMHVLVKPFLYLLAFCQQQYSLLFGSAFGLVCWLLTMCVRAISRFTWLQVNEPRCSWCVLRPEGYTHN
jgi:hypothetical protein